MSKPYNPYMILNKVDLVPYEDFLQLYPQYSTRLRWNLFAEKGTSCVSCGLTGTHAIIWHQSKDPTQIHSDLIYLPPNFSDLTTMVMITMDHIIPKAKGGPKTIDNLQPMCSFCNTIKSDDLIALEHLPEQIAFRKKQRYFNLRLNAINADIKKQEHNHHVNTMRNELPCTAACYLCFTV